MVKLPPSPPSLENCANGQLLSKIVYLPKPDQPDRLLQPCNIQPHFGSLHLFPSHLCHTSPQHTHNTISSKPPNPSHYLIYLFIQLNSLQHQHVVTLKSRKRTLTEINCVLRSILLMCNENNNGKRIQPCRKPHTTLNNMLCTSPTFTSPSTSIYTAFGKQPPGHQSPFSPNNPMISLGPLCCRFSSSQLRKPAKTCITTMFEECC